MSGGSGGGTSQSTGPPPWAQPFAGSLLGGIENALFPGMGGPNNLPSMPAGQNYSVAGFTPDQLQALKAMSGEFGQASGLAGAGAGLTADTLSGKYLNPSTNPYLAGTAQAANQATIDQYQQAVAPSRMAEGQMAAGGGPGALTGSGFQQAQMDDSQVLARQLGQQDTQLYGQNYANERANQMNALGQLGATESALFQPSQELLQGGQYQQQQQQNILNTATQNAIRQGNYPFMLGDMASSIFAALTGGSSQINTSGGK